MSVVEQGMRPVGEASSAETGDVRLALRATGLLRAFNSAGVLAAADVHVASRLGRLGGETEEKVLLAAALAVRAARLGSVCLELGEARRSVAVEDEQGVDVGALPWPEPVGWTAACAASPLVAVGPAGDPWRPLRLVDGLLYLDRYWRQEELVRDELDTRAARPVPPVDEDRLRSALGRLFPDPPPDRQRLAALMAALRPLTVVAGGPGTGKTTTVARLLTVLQDQPGPAPRIALAAPTGKAAARLQEAVREEAAARGLALGEVSASTLHRLLGSVPGRSRFRHDRHNRLPHDVVVVDETSMVSLTLMARLMEAIRPDARLVLVGDPDQLASVEAGAVLGDLVARPATVGALPPLLTELAGRDLDPGEEQADALRGGVVRLRTIHRFGGSIGTLAAAVQAGDPAGVLAILTSGAPDLEFVECDAAAPPAGSLDALRADIIAAGQVMAAASEAGDVVRALESLGRHRLLCAHRQGPYGVARWSEQVDRWLTGAGTGASGQGPWYRGRPLLVTQNDYELRLYNGDTGVVVDAGPAGVQAAFSRGGEPVLLPPSRLSAVQTVHAMTVHRSQGSQYERVSLVLPPAESPLLTRELFYTAVTRATGHVRVVGTRAAVVAAVARPILRASGLRRPRDIPPAAS